MNITGNQYVQYALKKIFSFTTVLQALTTDLHLICEDITFLYQPQNIKIACINKVVQMFMM